MAAKKSKKYRYKAGSGNRRLLFDARGERVRQSPLDNKFLRILLFAVLPYLVVNIIIFLIVCSSPRVSIKVGDTHDYMTADLSVTVKSLLPLKSVEITEESEELSCEKTGSSYLGIVTKNGTVSVRAAAVNGMVTLSFADVSVLDDTAPNVDESSATITDSTLSFAIYDTQSGVDFDSISGIVNEDETIYPESIDRELGIVSMILPSDTETVDLSFSDMVGNMRTGRITVTLEGVDTEQEDDSDRYLTEDIEAALGEYAEET